MSRGLASRSGLEGASRVPNTSRPFCQTTRSNSQPGRTSGQSRTIPPVRQLRRGPARIGYEVGPGPVEGEVARFDVLDHPAALRAYRLLVGDPVVAGEGEALGELLLVLPLPGAVRGHHDVQV